MNEFWRFDNSEFIKSLENRGFYVAPKSRSNYQTTWLSLASSLNMEYLPENLSIDTTQSINNIPFIEAIAQNKVAKFLKSIGYQYIHLPHNAALTKKNNQADIIITNKKYISLFSQHILNKTFLKTFNLPVGLSDHSFGLEAAIAAVTLGSSVVEKHFTLDREMKGPDHASSIEREGMRLLVSRAKRLHIALGLPDIRMLDCELPVRKKFRGY